MAFLALMLAAAGASIATAQQLPDPFTPADRWSAYLHRTYAPDRLGFLAVDTAMDQMFRKPACWNAVATSFGRRYVRSFQGRIVRNSADLAMGMLTGEDLRYHHSQSPSIRGRLWNALRSSVTAQMPNGSRRPAYTRFFDNELAILSSAPWTRHPIRPEWMAKSVGWTALDQAETNILDEFGPDLRRIGLRLWNHVRPH